MNTNLLGIVVSVLLTNYANTSLHTFPCAECGEPHAFELVTRKIVVKQPQSTVFRDGHYEVIDIDEPMPVAELFVTNQVRFEPPHPIIIPPVITNITVQGQLTTNFPVVVPPSVNVTADPSLLPHLRVPSPEPVLHGATNSPQVRSIPVRTNRQPRMSIRKIENPPPLPQ